MCRRGSPGKGQRTPGNVPSRGHRLPPPPRKRPRAATGRSSRPAGSGPGAGSRVGRSSASRGVALPVPARRGGRTRVLASRPRAPPGLASAAAPEAGGPGLCAAERRGRRAERTAASPESVGHSGRPRRGPARSCPRPPGAGRVRALPSSPDWAPWRCPGVRHPRGAHRLDPGGPAAGRRPQVHGGLGAR